MAANLATDAFAVQTPRQRARVRIALLAAASAVLLVAGCGGSLRTSAPAGRPATTAPSPPVPSGAAPTASAAASPVPALSVDHPQVSVTPDQGLRAGETVVVRVTGFGTGGKVWLSECGSAEEARDLGCGAQLAAQPFLVTDNARSGETSFSVTRQAPTRPVVATPTLACTTACVIVATMGGGFPYATAPIGFAPATATPSLAAAAACTAGQLATSVVDTGAAAGTVEGWLRFDNTSPAPCSLAGYPTLVGVTASGSGTVARRSDVPLNLPPDASPVTVTLVPGASAVAAFVGGDNPVGITSTCQPAYRTLRVAPPGIIPMVSLSAFNSWLNADLPACDGIEVTMVVAASSQPDLLPWRP